MPLVIPRGDGGDAASEAPTSDAHARARKIRPELARGDLVLVAAGRNQAEAELIQGLLLEEGIPSLVRRSAAFDVPDFLAAGQRDVLVPESGAAAARDLLAQAELWSARAGEGLAPPRPSHVVRLVAAITAGALLAASLAWVLVAAST
jgi:hypothetical protein